jgi:hypothetical protein
MSVFEWFKTGLANTRPFRKVAAALSHLKSSIIQFNKHTTIGLQNITEQLISLENVWKL